VSPVKYELGFYIPEDDILHSHRRDNLKAYIIIIDWKLVCAIRLQSAPPVPSALRISRFVVTLRAVSIKRVEAG
jgi:hypothetical protein